MLELLCSETVLHGLDLLEEHQLEGRSVLSPASASSSCSRGTAPPTPLARRTAAPSRRRIPASARARPRRCLRASGSATVPSTGTWKVCRELSVGIVRLEPGVHRISVHNGKPSGPLMKLRSLRLVAQ